MRVRVPFSNHYINDNLGKWQAGENIRNLPEAPDHG